MGACCQVAPEWSSTAWLTQGAPRAQQPSSLCVPLPSPCSLDSPAPGPGGPALGCTHCSLFFVQLCVRLSLGSWVQGGHRSTRQHHGGPSRRQPVGTGSLPEGPGAAGPGSISQKQELRPSEQHLLKVPKLQPARTILPPSTPPEAGLGQGGRTRGLTPVFQTV